MHLFAAWLQLQTFTKQHISLLAANERGADNEKEMKVVKDKVNMTHDAVDMD